MPITTAELMAVFPKGIILPWYTKSGSMPAGWSVCDGTNGTPDLRKRFIRGVSDFADVGPKGGSDTITVSADGRKGSDKDWGTTPWAPGPNPAAGGQSVPSLPPYVDILYIMFTG